VDISLCDYSFSQQEEISIIKFPKWFSEISWVEISLYSLYWLYNNLSFLLSEATQGKASAVAEKDGQTTEPRTFDTGFSGKVNLSTLGFQWYTYVPTYNPVCTLLLS